MTDYEKLTARLDRIARENRLLKLLLGAGAVLVISIILFRDPTAVEAQPRKNQPLSTEKLTLVDKKGKVRGEFGLAQAGPTLSLLDQKGEPRFLAMMGESGPSLSLLDKAGDQRIVMNVNEDGPMVLLFDDKQKMRVSMQVLGDKLGIAVHDKNEKIIWSKPD